MIERKLRNLLKSLLHRLYYGAMACPLSAMAVTYYVVLPKWYAENAGISISDLGLWLLLSRVWDAISDPICGMISDRLLKKGVGRKQLIRLGSVLILASFFMLLNPSTLPYFSAHEVFIFFSFLFYTGFTLVSVPYEAMAVEVEPDSVRRTGLIGARDGLLVVGTISAAVLPLVFYEKGGNGLFYLSIAYSLLFLLALVIFERGVDIKKTVSVDADNFESVKEFFRTLKTNSEFLRLISSFIINSLGAALPAALFLFYVQYILRATEQQGFLALILYFVIGFVFLPVWLLATSNFKKKHLWFLAQIINAGAFIPVVFLGAGDYYYFLSLVLLSAIGFGGVMVLPSLLQADIIEVTCRTSGKKREGGLVGLWSVARKMSQALGSGAGLYILGISGFDAELQPGLDTGSIKASTEWTLAVLYAVVPSILSLMSIIIAWPLKAESDKTGSL